MKDRPLTVGLEKDELVIRIGLDILIYASERQQDFWSIMYDKTGKCPEEPYVKIVDDAEFISDVISELNKEEEDGTTPIHRLLDKAVMDAYENGSLGFADED